MSELIQKRDNGTTIRWKLLTGASALALAAYISSASAVSAADADKPMIWLDVSGQLDQLSGSQSRWVPDFLSGPYAGPLAGSFQDVQKTPRFGFDANAGVSIFPGDNGWVFSASVRLGRARQPGSASKLGHILSSADGHPYGSHYGALSHETESHLFIDFSAGKDVGLGIAGGESTVSLGVRFANLRSRSDVQISSNFPLTFHGSATNEPDTRISREFHGWGPKIAWDGSAPIAGTEDDGQLGMDWGVNAALLFGRQTTKQKTDAFYRQHYAIALYNYVIHTQTPHSTNLRRKNATVPALGAYAALSYNLPNVKLSLGYRADWYFHALDDGIAASQKVDRGFYGPFASISIGVSPSDF